MNIKFTEDGVVAQDIVREVKVGQVLRINPSEAFMGIYSGVITIMAIDSKDTIDPVYVDTWLGDMGVDIDNPTEEDKYTIDYMKNSPWVHYRYNNENTDESWYTLPLPEFIDHTMHY